MMPRILLSALFCVRLAPAQHSFPLNVGDMWQYHSSDPLDTALIRTRVVGDSLSPNGKTYKYISESIFATSFLRTSGAKVFGYSSYDTTEFLLFDFNANPGDTMSILHNGGNTILLRDTWLDSGTQDRYWYFIMYQGPPGSWYEFFEWWIRDSVGVTGIRVEPGRSYNLTGAVIHGDTIGTIMDVHDSRSVTLLQPELSPNYPNPFNPATKIQFTIVNRQLTIVNVYDLVGRVVATLVNEVKEPGTYTVQFDGSNLASGVYLYRIQAGSFVQTRKLLLLR
jgi:hypothetical protein